MVQGAGDNVNVAVVTGATKDWQRRRRRATSRAEAPRASSPYRDSRARSRLLRENGDAT
jgi:hypothetical protein